MKNIVIINGSPRKGGNTELLADSFKAGAEGAGHKVSIFETRKKKIKPCVACDTCFSKGVACSIGDDFNELAALLENADVLVFATPLYWASFSANIKLAIDKLHSFKAGKKPLKIKEAVLLLVAGTDDEKDFEGIFKSYETILRYKRWKNAGIIAVPGVDAAGAIKNNAALEKAKELGKSL